MVEEEASPHLTKETKKDEEGRHTEEVPWKSAEMYEKERIMLKEMFFDAEFNWRKATQKITKMAEERRELEKQMKEMERTMEEERGDRKMAPDGESKKIIEGLKEVLEKTKMDTATEIGELTRLLYEARKNAREERELMVVERRERSLLIEKMRKEQAEKLNEKERAIKELIEKEKIREKQRDKLAEERKELMNTERKQRRIDTENMNKRHAEEMKKKEKVIEEMRRVEEKRERELKVEREELKKLLETMEMERAQTVKQVETMKVEREQTAKELETVKMEREQTAKELETVKMEREQTAKELETVKMEREQTAKELETVKMEREQTQKELERSREEVIKVKEDCTRQTTMDVDEKEEGMKTQEKEYEQQIDKLHTEKKRIEKRLEELRDVVYSREEIQNAPLDTEGMENLIGEAVKKMVELNSGMDNMKEEREEREKKTEKERVEMTEKLENMEKEKKEIAEKLEKEMEKRKDGNSPVTINPQLVDQNGNRKSMVKEIRIMRESLEAREKEMESLRTILLKELSKEKNVDDSTTVYTVPGLLQKVKSLEELCSSKDSVIEAHKKQALTSQYSINQLHNIVHRMRSGEKSSSAVDDPNVRHIENSSNNVPAQTAVEPAVVASTSTVPTSLTPNIGDKRKGTVTLPTDPSPSATKVLKTES